MSRWVDEEKHQFLLGRWVGYQLPDEQVRGEEHQLPDEQVGGGGVLAT